MTKFFILLASVVLCGCGADPSQDADLGIDQCNRQEQMLRCLSTTPAGPQATNKSDWADVVDNCSGFAYRSSIRQMKNIKPECAVQL